ncbi:MAG TPA: HD domain-containing protein [Vicinamibacterales bacterium]
MGRLPRIAELTEDAEGFGFYLCARKELRTGRGGGDFVSLVLQDVSGQVPAKIFEDVDTLKHEFDAGEFVKVQGRGNRHHQKMEILVEKIRRVTPAQDALDGFREEDCIPCSPRALDEMWTELGARVAQVKNPWVRRLLDATLERHGDRLRIWPAALLVHHAYRGGLLEHILKIAEVGSVLAAAYGADADLVLAGAVLHDIGKLEELDYDGVTTYSRRGNLLGHITMGAQMVREMAASIDGFPEDLRTRIEHLVVSHHGERELGSPVEPMTEEAFILSAIDDLDAQLHQFRRHVAEDATEGAFTAFHPRFRRVLLKPSGR